MPKWFASSRYRIGYDSDGVYHDDPDGLSNVLLYWLIRGGALMFWNLPAIALGFALLSWVEHGLIRRSMAGWMFCALWVVTAFALSWLMSLLTTRMKRMRKRGDTTWMLLFVVIFAYDFVVPVLFWHALVTVGLGWWRAGGPHAWIGWALAVGLGSVLFWRNRVRILRG